MSGIKDTATVTLNVNGAQAKQVLSDLEEKIKSTEASIKKMQAAGADPKHIQQAEKQLRTYRKQLDEMRSATEGVSKALTNLDRATPRQLEKALRTLNRQLKDMTPGTATWQSHIEKIQQLQAQLKQLKTQVQGQESLWQRFTIWWFQCGQAVAAVVAGYQTLLTTLRSYVNDFASMEEEIANTRKFTGMSEASVRNLNNEFKKIDTRSSREQLNKLAQEAGRLGKSSKKDVLEFVNAADIINVALDELGDGATLEISKITDIFNIEQKYGTYDSMLKVSSVVNDLSQSCTASAPYIVEFTKRLAGVGAQANMTVPQIMAFGATMDALGLNVEMSATAVSQSIMKLFQKPKEIAQALGLDVKKFTDTLRKDTTQGFLTFLEAINKLGGGKDGAGMMALAPLFEDLQLDGARMSAVLGSAAQKVNVLRSRIDEANDSFKKGTSTLNEYSIFNNTVQASLDKAKNRLHNISVELGEVLSPLMVHFISSSSAVMQSLMAIITFTGKYRGEIASLVSAYVIYRSAIVVHNALLDLTATKTLLASKATALWHTVQSKMSGVLAIGRTAIAAVTNAVQYFTNGLQVNYAMQQRWRAAMAGMSFASWTGLILALASAIMIVYRNMKRLEEEARVVDKVRKEAIKKVGEERVSLDLLLDAANNETLSLAERHKAIARLNDIIPDYNGQLDETTGKYKANKKALDDYLTSLTRQYELEGAKSKLSDIGKEKAEAKIELTSAQTNYDKAVASFSSGKGIQYTTSWGMVGNTGADNTSHLASVLKSAESKYMSIVRKEQRILDAYGIELQKAELKDSSESSTNDDKSDLANGGMYHSAKEIKKEAKKALADAKRELAKANESYKAAMDRAKGLWESGSADNIMAYSTGDRTYEDYIAEKERLDMKYVQDRIAIYNNLYQNESKENKALLLKYDEDYQALLLKRAELDKKFSDARAKSNIDKLKREMKENQDAYNLLFYNPDSDFYGDAYAQQEAIHQLRIRYLTKFRDLYKKGSEEYLQYERQIEDENASAILAKRKSYLEKLEEWRTNYSYLTLSKRRDLEVKILDGLHQRGIVKEEEYQRILAQIRQKYSSEMFSSEDGKIDYRSSGDQMKGRRQAQNDEKLTEFDRIQSLYDQGLMTDEQYHQARRNVTKHYADLMFEDIRSGLDEQTRMLFDLGTAWQTLFAGIAETGKISFEDIGSVAQATFAVMSAGLEMYGQFAEAQARIEIANVQRRYDKEIELAQGNSYKTAKLEKKKEEEIARLKKEATRKEFNIKVITAIAQTAQNALAAYGAGLQAGFPMALWLAPTLAGLATANGLVQVALLKKQQQAAEAEGYAEGGFTKKGSKYEPAGIVHAGEWVASQKLLANPVARPLIDALDYAQRTNTFGSLKGDDVSRSITAPVTIARLTEGDASSAALIASVLNSTEVISRLNDRLDEPFVTVNTVTGDHGIKQAQDEYSRLINNVTPKKYKK